MTKPLSAAVILFPGSNREGDVARALSRRAAREPAIVWHDDRDAADGTDLVVLPGGFSYGDYLRCGAIAARARIMDAVRAHAARGGLVLGICNGFQILCEAGLLPGVLMRNAGPQFICRMQHLRVENAATPFTRGYRAGPGDQVRHRAWRGQLHRRCARLAELERSGRVAFRYCDAAGVVGGAANPNGSINDIAGVYNDAFNVLGLMPHPENLIDPLVGGIDGRGMFRGLTAA